MALIKCMVCDSERQILNTHLRQHKLTTAQYRQMFPQSPLTSDEFKKRFHRNCTLCGSPFTTGRPQNFYCPRCSKKARREKHRQYSHLYIRRRNNSLHVYNVAGTFGKSYLEITNGRVKGAVLLQKGISFRLKGWTEFEGCGSASYLMAIIDHIAYCSVCSEKLHFVKENEHYTIPLELCCSKCGLVYELDSEVFKFSSSNP